MGSRPPKFLRYFRDRKRHPNPLSLPHNFKFLILNNFKILIYCCLLIPYLLWRFTHTPAMAAPWTCQLSAEWLRHWADSTQVKCLSGHSGPLSFSGRFCSPHWPPRLLLPRASRKSCSAGVPCLHPQLEGSCAVGEWSHTDPSTTSHPQQCQRSKSHPTTGGVSLTHLLCTSANISVISGSDTLLVSDPEITSLLKTTEVGGKFGCSSVTMVFPGLKPQTLIPKYHEPKVFNKSYLLLMYNQHSFTTQAHSSVFPSHKLFGIFIRTM